MTEKHCFKVMGLPQAKGNMKGFPRGRHVIITDGNRNLKGWEQAVRYEAQRYVEGHKVQCADKTQAVVLTLSFYFQRPKTAPKALVHHNKRPDLDKLVRAVGDALTGILFVDDGQIDLLVAGKGYAHPGEASGVWIEFSSRPIKEARSRA